jgi:hypothetical protein
MPQDVTADDRNVLTRAAELRGLAATGDLWSRPDIAEQLDDCADLLAE